MINFLKKRWYLVLVTVLVLGFLFFKFASKPKTIEKSYKVKMTNLKEELSFSGQIDALEKVTLRFQTSGRLAWVGVSEGDYVKKYQSIASLDQRDVKKTLEKKLLAFSKTRWDFDQTKDDNKDVLTDKIKRVLEKSQFDLTSSILDVELQNLTLEYSYLSSPIEGIVTHVSVPYAGVNITPAGADFEVVNPKSIYFSATADQTEVIKLKEGDEGDLVLDAYPDLKNKVKINYLGFTPKTGETGTVYEVRMKISGSINSESLRYGMTGDATFVLREKNNLLAIPDSYLKGSTGNNYVYMKTNNKRNKVKVETGDEIDGMIEITSGLKANDIIYD
ncbi:efflux RND transporter periplasmic adaptor subunit [Candidatus Roizmanbacteria bacterium]|nr:efflux RND transporter periplasmic adaptor subunit [Candidatus Roizmanbacteria bacterium]